ncbi:hypothetical protein JXA85_00005, partial [Candidatus Woesearchaeota archaeon]|nr:hypothetical protein [Candidatus Woesearchaeota archaeon]
MQSRRKFIRNSGLAALGFLTEMGNASSFRDGADSETGMQATSVNNTIETKVIDISDKLPKTAKIEKVNGVQISNLTDTIKGFSDYRHLSTDSTGNRILFHAGNHSNMRTAGMLELTGNTLNLLKLAQSTPTQPIVYTELSHDGSHALYVKKNGRGLNDIYLIDLKSGITLDITNFGPESRIRSMRVYLITGKNSLPSFISPSKDLPKGGVAYIVGTKAEFGNNIFIYDISTGKTHNLTQTEDIEYSSVRAANQGKISYNQTENGNLLFGLGAERLYKLQRKRGAFSNQTTSNTIGNSQFLNQFVELGNGELVTRDEDGQLSIDNYNGGVVVSSDPETAYSVSPDRNLIVFSECRGYPKRNYISVFEV